MFKAGCQSALTFFCILTSFYGFTDFQGHTLAIRDFIIKHTEFKRIFLYNLLKMLESIYNFIAKSIAPLYSVLYRNDYFFLDYWSFVHFISGFIIMVLLTMKVQRRHFLWLFILLLSWETEEWLFVLIALKIFRPEVLPDQVTDIVVGFCGGLLGWYGNRRKIADAKGKKVLDEI